MVRLPTDPWLDAARALKSAAEAHPVIVRLDESNRYETRGLGPPVRGVDLRSGADAVEAALGLVLDETAAMDQGIPALVGQVRARLMAQWGTLEPQTALRLRLDVLELAPPRPSDPPPRPAPLTAPFTPSEPSDDPR